MNLLKLGVSISLISTLNSCKNQDNLLEYSISQNNSKPKITILNLHTGEENTFCKNKSFALIAGNGTSSILDEFTIEWRIRPKIENFGPNYYKTVPYQSKYDSIRIQAYYTKHDSTHSGVINKIVTLTNNRCNQEAI